MRGALSGKVAISAFTLCGSALLFTGASELCDAQPALAREREFHDNNEFTITLLDAVAVSGRTRGDLSTYELYSNAADHLRAVDQGSQGSREEQAADLKAFLGIVFLGAAHVIATKKQRKRHRAGKAQDLPSTTIPGAAPAPPVADLPHRTSTSIVEADSPALS